MSSLRMSLVSPLRCSLVWSGLLLFSTGCSTLPSANQLSLLGKSSNSAAPAATSTGNCTVEFYNGSKRTKSVDLPVSEGARVQTALEQSKALRRFRNLDVVLVRPVQHPSAPNLKLACRFDRKERRIAWDSDYAVMPGDRIMVREAKANSVENVLGSVVGPVLSGK